MERIIYRLLAISFIFFFISGCSGEKDKPLSFEGLLDRSLNTHEVLSFRHETVDYFLTVFSRPTPHKYYGIGLMQKVTATGSKILKPAEILFLIEEPHQLYEPQDYGPVCSLITSLPQLSLVHDEQIVDTVTKIAETVEEDARAVFDLYVTNKSMDLMFVDGFSIHGVSISVSARSMASLLSQSPDDANKFPFRKYPEYQVKKTETPIITAYGEERLSFPEVYTRMRVSSVHLPSGPGILTDRFVWAAQNGYFEDYEFKISLRNEYDLCRFKLIDSSETSEIVPLIALSYLESVSALSDPVMAKRDQRVLSKLKEIRNTLDAAWHKRELDAVYIRFKDRPPFIGYLREYVPGYYYDEIIHAVLEDRNGDYVLLTDPLEIEEIKIQTSADVREWTELVASVQRRRQIEFPTTPVLHFSNKVPLIYTGEKPWSKGCKISLSRVAQMKTLYIPNSTKPRLKIDVPDASFFFLFIEGFIEVPQEKDKDFVLLQDEFRLYDRNGDFYQMKCFMSLDGIDHVCSIPKLTGTFKLVVVVPNREPVFFFQFRDAQPIPVVVTETIPQEYRSNAR